jgi:hypothetical protein
MLRMVDAVRCQRQRTKSLNPKAFLEKWSRVSMMHNRAYLGCDLKGRILQNFI